MIVFSCRPFAGVLVFLVGSLVCLAVFLQLKVASKNNWNSSTQLLC